MQELEADDIRLVPSELRSHRKELAKLVPQGFLVFLGPPGTGKTRFSMAWLEFVLSVYMVMHPDDQFLVVLDSWTRNAVELLVRRCLERLKEKFALRLVMLGKEWEQFCKEYKEYASVMELGKEIERWQWLLRQKGLIFVCGTVGKLAYVPNSVWTANETLYGKVDLRLEDEATQILHTSSLSTIRYDSVNGLRSVAADPRQLPAHQYSARTIPTLMFNLLLNHRSLFLDEQYRQPDNLNAFSSIMFYA